MSVADIVKTLGYVPELPEARQAGQEALRRLLEQSPHAQYLERTWPGGASAYIQGQQARYAQAGAGGDTDLMRRLEADARRVGYALPAPAAQTQTPRTQTLQKLLSAGAGAGLPYTSNWMEALQNVQNFVAAHRAPSLWASVPAGTKTLQREQLEEAARHNRALEEISRQELALAGQRAAAGAGAGAKLPPTAGERQAEAEAVAFGNLLAKYQRNVSDPAAYQAPFVTATEVIRGALSDPGFRQDATRYGVDLYNVLDSFTQTALGVPLSRYIEDLGSVKTPAEEADWLGRPVMVESGKQDPLYRLLEAMQTAREGAL